MYLMRMSSNLCVSSTNKPNSIQVSSPPLKPIQPKLEKDQEQEEKNEEEEESSSSCSFSKDVVVVNSSNTEGETEQVREEEDEGYHTPTSPRHRIPAAVECPPAPRKPVSRRRHVKRKACCGIEIVDVELMVFSVSEMDEDRRSKKTK